MDHLSLPELVPGGGAVFAPPTKVCLCLAFSYYLCYLIDMAGTNTNGAYAVFFYP